MIGKYVIISGLTTLGLLIGSGDEELPKYSTPVQYYNAAAFTQNSLINLHVCNDVPFFVPPLIIL